jgi:hypothetical protein
MNYDEQQLKMNAESHQLELEIQGSIAFIEYKLSGNTAFSHSYRSAASTRRKRCSGAIVQKSIAIR